MRVFFPTEICSQCFQKMEIISEVSNIYWYRCPICNKNRFIFKKVTASFVNNL